MMDVSKTVQKKRIIKKKNCAWICRKKDSLLCTQGYAGVNYVKALLKIKNENSLEVGKNILSVIISRFERALGTEISVQANHTPHQISSTLAKLTDLYRSIA